MEKGLSSKFFRIATIIQSRSDAFDKSELIIASPNQPGSYRNIVYFEISSKSERR